ncbi:MAG: hypothetical protein J6Q17_05185 [Clostridia bacterium]|nr:hypothetical protein [Clostridia bacterium]
MYHIRIRPGEPLGAIRDMHGVGGGPVSGQFSFDATGDFRNAGIPFCRTHDIEYPFGAGEFVDVHNVFRDFGKDENDPRNYNFTFTDEYLKGILGCGAKPFYRLGSTIEHQPIRLYVNPPEDYAKWGRICSHIISHYNEGWADGFAMGIEYWEFWNEPEIPQCWTGSEEEFLRFYAEAAPEIKRGHPGIKLGGCAFCSPDGGLQEKFLSMVRKKGLPLDFYSWHAYLNDPGKVRELGERADAILKKYGFDGIESILDEWNYVIRFGKGVLRSYELHKTAFECAFMAAVMSEAQASPISKAMYYDAQMVMLLEFTWNGVFGYAKTESEEAARKPVRKPGYYALYAWNELKSSEHRSGRTATAPISI